MLNLNTFSKKYLSCVKHELKPYSFAFKKRALHTLTNDLLNFQEDMPKVDFEHICEHFGHPDKFADNLLESVDANELKKGLKKSKITMWVVIAALILFLVVSTLGLYKIITTKVTHTVETTIVYVED